MHPNQFIGTWEIVQDTGEQEKRTLDRYVSIGRNIDKKGNFVVESAKPLEKPKGIPKWNVYSNKFSLDSVGGFLKCNILDNGKTCTIFPWRNKNTDILVFCIVCEKEGKPEIKHIMSARGVSWKKRHMPGAKARKECSGKKEVDKEEFVVTASTGSGTQESGNRVFIRTLRASNIPPSKDHCGRRDNADLGIYGVFYQEPVCRNEKIINYKDPVLYDVLVYNIGTQAYESVFGIRSVSVDRSDKAHPQVFAAFESLRTMPEGYSGNILGRVPADGSPPYSNDSQSQQDRPLSHNLSAHMPFEQKILNSIIDATGDPDSGCWGGGGG